MNKQSLRQLYKLKRIELLEKERMRLDDLMLIAFQQINYSAIKTVLSYWPISGYAEPNTQLFSGYLQHMIPDISLAYPYSESEKLGITALAINVNTVYQTNRLGITEPTAGTVLEPSNIDLILVPLLICDRSGYRVGYGKGYYDRYLAKCRKNVVKVGFSYFEPVEKITDTNQFDVPLTYCITPQHTYEF